MSEFIPFPLPYDDVPIDISFVFENERPAGKHGFLKTEGRNFVFEDGTRVAFWGTNFNGAGCFPEHGYAEMLAKRLAKIGINLVRFHQLDAEWHTPNLFAFTKGKPFSGSAFDPESLDRLDYLIACLKENGIYIYMDMFTYRKFKSWEGVENAENLADAAKPYSVFSDKLIALQKDLCQRLWTHKNPYTGLTYADDPVFVLAEITNECDLFGKTRQHIVLEPYKTEFLEKFDCWLAEKGIDKKAADFDLMDYEDETLTLFKIDLQEKYYKDMMAHMRRCGVKIPITGNNWIASQPANIKTQLVTDFLDAHAYRYNWQWKEFDHRCDNLAISRLPASFLGYMALATAKDKPTYISEWDMTWPNEFRAESPIYCAAVGNLQGWSGFAIHTYAYSARTDRMNMLGKEISATKIGGTPYREGIFSTWNDPAKFGLFYHAALITRRGDVAPSENTLTFHHTSMYEKNLEPAFENVEKSTVIYDSSTFPEITPPEKDESIFEVLSDTGELYRNWKKHYGYIDSPKTKCVYGSLCKNGPISLSGMKVECFTDFATIAVSSLSDADISKSDNLLLTAVGRAENTDAKFTGNLLLDYGRPPITIEVIYADIEIETEVSGLSVMAVSAEGYFIGKLPSVYEDNKLKFSIGTESKTMYYLICKE